MLTSPVHPLHCSGLLGRTSLRQLRELVEPRTCAILFRSSRPDFIETLIREISLPARTPYCSGLLGRTSLRRRFNTPTAMSSTNCSGLLGRTSLRLLVQWRGCNGGVDCSGLLGRTSLRHAVARSTPQTLAQLFRSSRPDFIETVLEREAVFLGTDCSGLLGRTSLRPVLWQGHIHAVQIVPVF